MSITAAEGAAVVVDGWRLTVGELVTQGQADALPVGSVVALAMNPARTITKRTEGSCKTRGTSGWWYDDTNHRTALTNGVNRLVSVPHMGPVTLPEFKARFAARVREVTAEYTPTHRRVAERVLADLDRIGTDATDATSAPAEGTVAKKGSPDEPGFTIWRYDDGEWRPLLGSAPLDECRVKTTVSADGGLDEFRRSAWEQGQAVKQRFKWCSVFDEVMKEFGIVDPEPMPDFTAYEPFIKAQEGRDKLPVGSVVGESKGDWGVFQKTSNHGGPEDWRRVCGTRPIAAGTMRLLYMGVGGVYPTVKIRDHGLSAFMPGCTVRGGFITRLP